MLPLTKKQEENYKKQDLCHTCKQQFYDIKTNEISSRVQDHCHYTENWEVLPVVYII